eukprot:GEMP01048779.1.p1 GENE.GEMP01048779.1~~GEMP01048779.1.p1  ORF type:complete len:226 (+),score=38.06 GEMP01048779.1:102-779(+)
MEGPAHGINVSSSFNREMKLNSRRFKRWEHNNIIVHRLRQAMFDSGEEMTDVEELPEINVGPVCYGPDPFERLAKYPDVLETFLEREESHPSGTRSKPRDPRMAWEAQVRSEFKRFRGWFPLDFLTSFEELMRRRWAKFGPLEFVWGDYDFFALPEGEKGIKELIIHGLDGRLRSVVHTWCLVMGVHSDTDKEAQVLRIYPPRSDESLLDLPEELSVCQVLSSMQ